MPSSLTETLFLSARRLTRARFRRSFFSLFIVLLLFTATCYLISFLPTGSDHPIKHDRPRTEPLSASRTSLGDVRIHIEDVADQIPKADAYPDESSAVAKPPITAYGDHYAWLDDNHLGNYESRWAPKKTRPGDGGRPYRINGRQEIDWDRAKSLQSQYGMNIAVSEFIPMDRSVPDLR